MKRQFTFKDHLRITFSIGLKDITDGIRNKNIIVMVLSALFVVVMYRMLPAMTEEIPVIRIYDAGNSSLVRELENSVDLQIRTYESEERLKTVLTDITGTELGLVIPADFDARLSAGEPPTLQAYVLYWLKPAEALQMTRFLEDQILLALGTPVEVTTEGGILYPGPEASGMGFLTSVGFIMVITMIGLLLPPHLLIEEKKTQTLDVLLVSPATGVHVMAGKAMAALFYSGLGIAIAIAINIHLILNWPLLLLTTAILALMMVALGLLLGALVDNRAQLTILAWVFIAPLLLPIFLSDMAPLVPARIIAILNWIPTVAIANTYRMVYSHEILGNVLLYSYTITLVIAAAALALVAWKIQRERV